MNILYLALLYAESKKKYTKRNKNIFKFKKLDKVRNYLKTVCFREQIKCKYFVKEKTFEQII